MVMRVRALLFLFILSISFPLITSAQATLYVMDMENASGTAKLANPGKIDSIAIASPSSAVFHPNLPELIYIGKNGNDFFVASYNLKTQATSLLLQTEEPISLLRMVPGGKSISFTLEVGGGRKQLTIFDLVSKKTTTKTDLGNIENYIWIDDNSILAVRGGDPNGLHLLTLRPKREIPVAQHVGAHLTQAGSNRVFAFIHKLSVDSWSIKTLDGSGQVQLLTETIGESEVLTLTPQSKVLMAEENRLFQFMPTSPDSWTEVALPVRVGSILGLSTDATGQKIAITATN
jgi:hypothetical protein